jgi:flagellar basal body-associated protein FliL
LIMTSLSSENITEAINEHDLNDPIDEESQKGARVDLGVGEIAEITGHELDEHEDEEIAEITGHELDKQGDEKRAEVTGDEPDDPEGEQNKKAAVYELDVPGDPERKSFIDNELSRSKDKQSKTFTEKKIKFKGIKNKFRNKRTLFLFLVAGVCLLVGGSYYFFHHKNGEKIISRSNIFPIPHDKSIIFESFIVPIQKKQGYTYISLNLLLELSNIKLKGEIVEKKEQLRGIIYDILEQEIHRVEDADALEKLKTLIIKRANTVLTSGEVREAIINNFLLV